MMKFMHVCILSILFYVKHNVIYPTGNTYSYVYLFNNLIHTRTHTRAYTKHTETEKVVNKADTLYIYGK